MITRIGLPKRTETYYFFRIDSTRVDDFRKQLSHLVPLITTSEGARHERQRVSKAKQHLTIGGINIVFSKKGLTLVSTLTALKDDI